LVTKQAKDISKIVCEVYMEKYDERFKRQMLKSIDGMEMFSKFLEQLDSKQEQLRDRVAQLSSELRGAQDARRSLAPVLEEVEVHGMCQGVEGSQTAQALKYDFEGAEGEVGMSHVLTHGGEQEQVHELPRDVVFDAFGMLCDMCRCHTVNAAGPHLLLTRMPCGPRRYHYLRPFVPTERLLSLKSCSLRAALPLVRAARGRRLAETRSGVDYSRFSNIDVSDAGDDSDNSNLDFLDEMDFNDPISDGDILDELQKIRAERDEANMNGDLHPRGGALGARLRVTTECAGTP